MSFVKGLECSDYDEIEKAVASVKHTVSVLSDHGVRIEIPHYHRYWEYGSAVHLARLMKVSRVLDVGAGWGAVGPTLALLDAVKVIEFEPDTVCRASRVKCNNVLTDRGVGEIEVLDSMPDGEFDAVFSISVMEHIVDDNAAMKTWASKVRHGGLLFITTDCVEEAGKSYVMDSLRQHNFTLSRLKEKVEELEGMGFKTLGTPDYAWHGAEVFDYSFFRLGLEKL